MSDIAVATSQKTPTVPTARKGPVTSSSSSKGSAKSQQQRKVSVSHTTTKAQQQRRASASEASSKTQQQPKNSNLQNSPKAVIQQRRQSAAAEGSTWVGDKRKTKAEEQPPKEVDFQVIANGADKGAAQPDAKTESLPKRQKIELMNTEIESARGPAATTPSNFSPIAPTPHQPPISQMTQPSNNNNLLLRHVLQTHPTLLPTSHLCPIASSHIDALAHTMWQAAFNHGGLLQRACQYSALFSPLKLAALAKLNFLPSWWFFREGVMKELPGLVKEMGGETRRTMDDREMQDAWKEAVRWCSGVLGDRFDIKGVVGEAEKGKT